MMPPERPDIGIPADKEVAQYVTYSAKELMHLLNEKVDNLDEKVDNISLEFAKLPAVYVTQESINEARHEAQVARRFAVASAIGSMSALGAMLGILYG